AVQRPYTESPVTLAVTAQVEQRTVDERTFWVLENIPRPFRPERYGLGPLALVDADQGLILGDELDRESAFQVFTGSKGIVPGALLRVRLDKGQIGHGVLLQVERVAE